MSDLPTSGTWSLYGIRYTVDLEACRERLLDRVAELRKPGFRRKGRGGMQVVAAAAGVDRATLRRFLQGKRLSVETFTAIITRGLQFDMRDVVKAEARAERAAA